MSTSAVDGGLARAAVWASAFLCACTVHAAIADSAVPVRRNAASPLGTNLEWVKDFSEEWIFVDAFRASRPWVSGTARDWQDSRELKLDANGWIASLAPGQTARTMVLAATGPYPEGDYIVLYEGEGSIQYGGAGIHDPGRSRPGRHVLRLDPTKRGVVITLAAVNPANPVRNIRVIMPGGVCGGDPFRYASEPSACMGAGPFRSFETEHAAILFHPRFLERLRTYRVIRFMNWSRVTNSRQVAWSDRPRPGDARWSTDKGVPIEVMVDLANRLGADAWFTLPHRANDDYATEAAKLVSRLLRSDLKAYLEYSNEIWNGKFEQASYARERGMALGLSSNPFQAQLLFYSRRSVELFDIWAREFGDAKRLVRVMASAAVNPWSSIQVLDHQNARKKTDALAIAPYFGNALGSPAEQARVQAMNLDALFAELETVALPKATEMIKSHAAIARTRGLPLIAYEAGQHLVGFGGSENNAAINALFDRANRDPRMGEIYRKYLDAWRGSGGTLMVHFLHCGPYTKFGRWGALEHQEQPRTAAPKFGALQRFIEQNPAWW